MGQRKYEKFKIKFAHKKTDSKTHLYTIYMQRIFKSENLQFEKQELERKMKFYRDSNIEKKRKLYKYFHSL